MHASPRDLAPGETGAASPSVPSLARSSRLVALLAVAVTVAPAVAAAQPLDPYAPGGDEAKPPPDADQPPPGVATDRDPDVDAAVAASLVARAQQLIAAERWADAQQLLSEAVVTDPEGPSSAQARQLLDEVRAHLGIAPVGGSPPIDPYAVDPVGPGGDGGGAHAGAYDAEIPPLPETPRAGAARRFYLHTAVMGAAIGGFVGDASTADVTGTAPKSKGGPIVGGVLLGGVAGLALGLAFRRSSWMTRDDEVVIDSFAGMGMIGSLGLAGVMKPAAREAYSVNALLGIGAGAVTGYVVAKRHVLSARRMGRVDLWAALGAATPWAIFGLAKGDATGAQVAGFFSMAGMVGGAWLGFRLTRDWDDHGGGELDAPMALVRRHSDGAWTLGAPALEPAANPALGPALGRGAAVDMLGARW